MELLRARLAADGVLVIQFIGDNGPWSASLVRTLRGAFGRGHCVLLAPRADRGGWPTVAIRRPRQLAATARRPAPARVPHLGNASNCPATACC